MASKPEFAAYAVEQLGGAQAGVTCRKMFGEYGLHVYGKFFAVICDNTLFVKQTLPGEALLRARGEWLLAPPYEGASEYFKIDNVEDAAFLRQLTAVTGNALPEPKPKKKKTKTAAQ